MARLSGRARGSLRRKGMKKVATEPDIPLEAVQSLLTRVIWQAVADLSVDAYQTEAHRFFDGQTFVEYCDILGWNVRRARDSLGKFLDSGSRISGAHPPTRPGRAAPRRPGRPPP